MRENASPSDATRWCIVDSLHGNKRENNNTNEISRRNKPGLIYLVCNRAQGAHIKIEGIMELKDELNHNF
jgi:hypothetical protein